MKVIFKNAILLLSFIFIANANSFAGEEIDKYLGRWALHFEEGMGWLEVRQEDGYIDADLLWRGGSVVPVANVFVADGKLNVTRISTSAFNLGDGKLRTHTITTTLVLEGRGKTLIGKFTSPKEDGVGADVYYVQANKIPPLPAAPDLSSAKFGNSIDLLNDGMDGWSLLEPQATNGWSIKKGVLYNNPAQKKGVPHIHYGNLRTNSEFQDFNLKLSVNVPEGSNSGVYLRGIYEVQVMDSYKLKLDNHHMGALYSRITPSESAERKAGKWQKMDITLYDRHLTVVLNGKKIIDNQPIYGVTGGAMTADEFVPGPIYLQGDHGEVNYKDIVLTPIIP